MNYKDAYMFMILVTILLFMVSMAFKTDIDLEKIKKDIDAIKTSLQIGSGEEHK